MLKVRVDFLTFTCPLKTTAEFENFFEDVLKFSPETARRWGFYGGSESRRFFRAVSGLVGSLRFDKKAGLYHFRGELSGAVCSVFDISALCAFLQERGVNFTRFDVALDDYCRRVSFDDVKSAGELRNYRLVNSYKVVESSVSGSQLATTCYFGSSDRVVRFYNAEAVHDIVADRWELQLRNDLATSAVLAFLDDSDCLASLVVGSIDFGVRGTHYDRFTRFGWWQSLIDSVGGVTSTSADPYIPNLDRSIEWLDRSVSPLLAVLKQGMGDDRFFDLISDFADRADSRLKPYHHEFIAALRQSYFLEVV